MLNVFSEQKILNLISSCRAQHAARPAPGQKAPKRAVGYSLAPESLVLTQARKYSKGPADVSMNS